ncbi:hypothetical protein CR161_06175 [Prosthecochloris sp. ZM]|uniref:hypothetical protein n=1 Tax=Prosthecochloris sp. ZM TaxID=2283143 RepID=UPI000DF7CE5F|nr:hypothetical protein [Prosthecochloris sp. ZM]RDD30330.1 hypothetical protein CR161_06175 [Prosthecochloris sp. ZM]
MTIVSSINKGAEFLLYEVADVLLRLDVGRHIVIGGWCPVLRNGSKIVHPGTIDVDVLFEEGSQPGRLAPLFSEFKSLGYGISAKHGFQLLRDMTINGERVLFNVDILHPLMSAEISGLFQDHLELDVPKDENERKLKKMVSIVQPNSRVLFEEHMYSDFSLGQRSISLVDFTGMYLTKIDSCQKVKRERDSLDLLIAIESNGVDFMKIADLRKRNDRIGESCDKFEKYLNDKGDVFDDNVSEFVDLSYSPSEKVLSSIT